MSVPTQGETKIIIEMPGGGDGDGGGGNTPVNPQPIDNQSPDPNKTSTTKQTWVSLAANTAKNLGMQAINASVSNIGLSTGNYYKQQQTQRTIQSMQTMAGLAMSFANPFTALVSFAGMAISAGSEIYQQKKERDIANYQSEQYAKRLGYTKARK